VNRPSIQSKFTISPLRHVASDERWRKAVREAEDDGGESEENRFWNESHGEKYTTFVISQQRLCLFY